MLVRIEEHVWINSDHVVCVRPRTNPVDWVSVRGSVVITLIGNIVHIINCNTYEEACELSKKLGYDLRGRNE